MFLHRKLLGTAGLLFGMLVTMTPSTAKAVSSFNFLSGDLSATANFELIGSTLTVTLTNTSAADVLVPTDVLTALFFSSNGGTLTPVSALLNGSTVLFGYPDGGGNVGGEWAYGSGLVGAPGGATQGISSTGLGLFGDANFGGTNLQDPLALNGLNYGITSAVDDANTGNTEVTGGTVPHPVALIQNFVVFTLTASDDFTTDRIDDVRFQYGTSLTEQVPEPSSVLLLGVGVILFGIWGLRKKRLA